MNCDPMWALSSGICGWGMDWRDMPQGASWLRGLALQGDHGSGPMHRETDASFLWREQEEAWILIPRLGSRKLYSFSETMEIWFAVRKGSKRRWEGREGLEDRGRQMHPCGLGRVLAQCWPLQPIAHRPSLCSAGAGDPWCPVLFEMQILFLNVQHSHFGFGTLHSTLFSLILKFMFKIKVFFLGIHKYEGM